MTKSAEIGISDLMRLVESNADAQSVLKTGFEWQHTRRLEIGKWFLTLGAASLVAIFTLLARNEPPPDAVIWAAAGLSGAAIAFGLNAIWRTRVIHVRYADASLLCSRLTGIRPFLTLLRQDGLI